MTLANSDSAAVIKTPNERNGGNNVSLHSLTHVHTRDESGVQLFLRLILGNDLWFLTQVE